MKIAILCEYGTLNGGEQSLLAVLHELRNEAVEFVVLAPAKGPLSEQLHTIGIKHLPISYSDDNGVEFTRPQKIERLAGIVIESGANLLHANSLSMGRFSGVLNQRIDIPCTAHLRDIIRLKNAVVADLNQNTAMVAVSEATRRYHIEQGLSDKRLFTIHNGIEPTKFYPSNESSSDERRQWRAELGIPDDAFVVATIGQICLRKGQNVFAAAICDAIESVPNLHVVIVGERYSSKDESIAFERQLHEQFQSSGISHRVHWLGYRDDIPRTLRSIDVLVHSAHQEPLGRVLLEAAACGCAIIATDVGGTPEILVHTRSALLITPGHVETLSSKIRDVASDVPMREQLKAGAFEASRQFHIRDKARELLQFWKSVID